MCHLHERKYRCPYPDLQPKERLLVDVAWERQRRAAGKESAGFAVLTASGSSVSVGVPNAAQYFRCETEMLNAARRGVKLLATVYCQGIGWPSHSYIQGLMEVNPAVDFLIVDARNGQTERWTLAQLLACDRTVDPEPQEKPAA
jgi:hypothetical protein